MGFNGGVAQQGIESVNNPIADHYAMTQHKKNIFWEHRSFLCLSISMGLWFGGYNGLKTSGRPIFVCDSYPNRYIESENVTVLAHRQRIYACI